MKVKIALFALLSFLALNLKGQNSQANFYIETGLINTYPITYTRNPEEMYFKPQVGYSFGFGFCSQKTKNFRFQAGIGITVAKFERNLFYLGMSYDIPKALSLTVLEAPISFVLNGKHIYGKLSILPHLDLKDKYVDTQTGIGASLAVGLRMNLLEKKILADIEPYIKVHTLFPFAPSEYQERLHGLGIVVRICFNKTNNETSLP